MCEQAAAKYEKTFNIPPGLLRAIATQESGKMVLAAKRRVSWPWTINVAGQGYYFSTKEKALQSLDYHMRDRGIESVDVGCMQINMKYHGSHFSGVREAIAPDANIRYAANFLRRRYEIRGNWIDAVSDYHNNRREVGGAYMKKVLVLWKKQNPSVSIADLARHEKLGGAVGEALLNGAPSPLPDIFGAVADGYRRFYGK